MATAEPVGLCLHGYSPDAPPEKLECFEFEKFDRVENQHRYFYRTGGGFKITDYRFRAIIPYKPALTPGNPEFAELLKLYEETAKSTPSTRPFLNPKILAMRALVAANNADEKRTASLPKISIKGAEYLSPKFKGIEKGKLVLGHRDGVVRLDLKDVDDQQLRDLAKIDPGAAKIKILRIGSDRLWNPRFQKLFNGTIEIAHEEGTLVLKTDSLTETDKTAVVSLSDGSWKLGKPGFYSPKSEEHSYGEVILQDGRFYKNVRLGKLEGDSILIVHQSGELKVPLIEIARLPGLTTEDSAKIAPPIPGRPEAGEVAKSPTTKTPPAKIEPAAVTSDFVVPGDPEPKMKPASTSGDFVLPGDPPPKAAGRPAKSPPTDPGPQLSEEEKRLAVAKDLAIWKNPEASALPFYTPWLTMMVPKEFEFGSVQINPSYSLNSVTATYNHQGSALKSRGNAETGEQVFEMTIYRDADELNNHAFRITHW